MNAKDIIKYGHLHVLEAVKGIGYEEWKKVGVTTKWSIKDLIAHLASYEHLLEDALNFVLKPGTPTPCLDKMNSDYDGFNDKEVGQRKNMTPQEVMKEYADMQKRVADIIEKTKPELLSKTGTIPWYGSEYSLDDFIVYASYGHKEGHIAQIKRCLKQKKNFQNI